jgi:hypothetical protein
MTVREILGGLTVLQGHGIAALCALVQGIPEFAPFAKWLLWGLLLGLAVIVLGLWMVVSGEESRAS